MSTRTLNRRKFLTGAGVTAAAALGLAGCVDAGAGGGSTGTETGNAPVSGEITGEIEFWTINLRKNFQDYFEALIADFESQHDGVTVTWVDVPGLDMETKYLASLASGAVPDAVNIDTKNFSQLAMTLTDLSAHFDEGALAAYQPGLIDGLRVDGTLYGIPWYNSGVLLAAYRKSTMDQVGFDPADPPQTWDDALALAAKVYDETGVYGANMAPENRILQAYGIEFVSSDLTEATFNTPEAAEVLRKFQDAYAAKAIAPGASAPDTAEPQTLDNGQIGFEPQIGPGQITTLGKNAPEAYEDLIVTPSPKTVDGKYQVPGQMAFSIPAQSKNPVTAAAFIAHVTSAQAQLEFCSLVPIFPSTVDTLSEPLFADNPGVTPEDKARQIVTDNFQNAVDTTIPLPAGVSNQVRMDCSDAFREAMRSGEAPEDVLAAAQAAFQESLDGAVRTS